MKSRTVKVECENGVHLRVAAEVVKTVQKHNSVVKISCRNCPFANACSIMEILMLGADKGSELEIIAEGDEEDKVLDSLEELFSNGAGI